MAIDSANKRLSTYNLSTFTILPFASGSISGGDRATTLFQYASDSFGAVVLDLFKAQLLSLDTAKQMLILDTIKQMLSLDNLKQLKFFN